MFLKDRLQINTKREYTDEGFLKVPARISRTGIQNYLASEMGLEDRNPNDIIKVFRPEEEVFSDDSLNSFTNKPITDDHPSELVTVKNAKNLAVGHAGHEVVRDGDFASTFLYIHDACAIKKVESGKVELSNGYVADIEWVSGVAPSGETYDAIQRNIRGNHIALVERGRAGSACRVADNLPQKGDKPMAKITIDGVDFEVEGQVAQAVGKLQAKLTDAENETSKKEDEAKKKEDEFELAKKKAEKTEDSLKAQLDAANTKIPTAKALDKMVADRTALIDSARKIVPEIDVVNKDADTLRKEVVSSKCPNVQMDSVSSDYINARFDMLLEDATDTDHNPLDDAFKHQVNNDFKPKDTRSVSTIAREKMMADSRDAWKGSAK